MGFAKTDQEEKLDVIFKELEEGFTKVDKAKDAAKAQTLLKDITNKLKDAKTCVTLHCTGSASTAC